MRVPNGTNGTQCQGKDKAAQRLRLGFKRFLF